MKRVLSLDLIIGLIVILIGVITFIPSATAEDQDYLSLVSEAFGKVSEIWSISQDGKYVGENGQVNFSIQSIHVYPGESIQAAIDAANDGEEIIIHEGTYVENINFLGKAIRVRGTDPNDLVVVEATIIDGDQAGSVVTFSNEEGDDSMLCGITVTNGEAEVGGGIYCYLSSPHIAHCIINQNGTHDTNEGGGVYCYNKSSPIIMNCLIRGNSADEGGGIYCMYESSPIISHCTINQNMADRGGGIYCYYKSSPIIMNCTIGANIADGGGGIYCSAESLPTIVDCFISTNIADEGGGIHCYYESSPIISHCTINQNMADEGGGINCWLSSPTIIDCFISDNSADEGGGIYCDYKSSPIITNCIIHQNLADWGGGATSFGDFLNPLKCLILQT